MRLTERYQIPVPITSVGPLFEDVLLIAPHVPGAEITSGTGEGPFQGVLSVAFGPRVIKLSGMFTYRFDPATRTGRLEGSGTDARGNSRATGHASFSLSAVSPGEQATEVQIDVELALTGPLAMIAETGAPHVARSTFADFSRSLVAQLRDRQSGAVSPGEVPAATPVSAFHIMRSVFSQLLAGLGRKASRIFTSVVRRRRGGMRRAASG